MPYVIRRKSENELIIARPTDAITKLKQLFIPLGLEILIVLAFFPIIILLHKTAPRLTLVFISVVFFAKLFSLFLKPDFEIKLNQSHNRLVITHPLKKQLGSIYFPLTYFKGFGVREIPAAHRSRRESNAELFFKFDETIDKAYMNSNNALTKHAALELEQKEDVIFWHVPIHATLHPTSIENAEQIIELTNNLKKGAN